MSSPNQSVFRRPTPSRRVCPWKPAGVTGSSPGSGNPGFALAIVLVLMAFVLLLLLSMSSLLRVESIGASAGTERVVARQNALLGLQIGLGSLQEAMGPDARVSARADLFNRRGEPPEIPAAGAGWIGAWDASILSRRDGETVVEALDRRRANDARTPEEKKGEVLRWLVSQPDLSDPVAPEEIGALGEDEAPILARLPVGDGTSVEELRVPRREILDPAAEEAGGYAFWIDDEGMKTRIDLVDPDAAASNDERLRERHSVARRPAPEIVVPGFPEDPRERRRLADASFLGNYGYDEGNARRHFTASASGVLADTVDGGLRRDLTQALWHVDRDGLPGEWIPQDLFDDADAYLFALDAFPGDDDAETVYGTPWTAIHDFLHMGERGPDGNWTNTNFRGPLRLEPGAPDFEHGDLLPTAPSALRHVSTRNYSVFDGSRNGPVTGPNTNYEAQARRVAEGTNLDNVMLGRTGFSPIVTEFRLYVSAGERQIEGAPRLILLLHPFVELTNPYDFALELNGTVGYSVRLPSPSVDFEVRRTDPTDPETEQYSDEGALEDDIRGRIEPRMILNLAMANNEVDSLEAEDDPLFGNEERRSSSLAIRFHLDGRTLPGDEIAPGETVSFVLGDTLGPSDIVGRDAGVQRFNSTVLDLVEGDRWNDHALEVPVRPYRFGTRAGDDREVVRYTDAFWPDTPGGLNDFDIVRARAEFSPLYQATFESGGGLSRETRFRGPELMTLAFGGAHAAVDFQIGSLLPPVADRLFGEVGSSGGAFVSDDSWTVGTPAEPVLLVYQIERLSAQTYEDDGVEDSPYPPEGFLARGNPRAYLFQDAHGFGGDDGMGSAGLGVRIYDTAGNANLQDDAAWGATNTDPDSAAEIFFHRPRPDEEPASIGYLRHANLGFEPSQPAYLIGNSRRGATNLDRVDTHRFFEVDASQVSVNATLGFTGATGINLDKQHTRHDYAVDSTFFHNRALWDDYFFSTLPRNNADADTETWLNPRFTRLPSESLTAADDYDPETALTDDRAAASRLLLKGAFNVNSTSEEAWAAFLASQAGIDYPGGAAIDADEITYPRTRYLTGGRDDVWAGFPVIDDEEIYTPGQAGDDSIDTLSRRIVEEVKRRGPFLSVDHFVNRLLVDDERGDLGALAAAIEASGINGGPDPAPADVPGTVTQHDLLEPLGPFLAARSDTFRIRVRGDALNPATTETGGVAYCEVVVQRMPEFSDDSQPPTTATDDLNAINRRFGRSFEVVEFRWLSEEVLGNGS